MSRKANIVPFPGGSGAKRPRPFGTIKRRRRTWYVRFPYYGDLVEVGTGLEATEANRHQLRELLDRLGEALRAGQPVDLAEVFPNATPAQKIRWARMLDRHYRPAPNEITFGRYARQWIDTTLALDPSGSKRTDYLSSLRSRILPWFKDRTFAEITGPELTRFVQTLAGTGLSEKRIKNILIPLRVIYTYASAEYGWEIPDPFAFLAREMRCRRIVPRGPAPPPEAFRLDEWLALVDAFDPWYRPIAEIMVMTGMSASELAGLRREDLTERLILVRRKISRGTESAHLKTPYRTRELPMTRALWKRFSVLLARAGGTHVVVRPDGEPFSARVFWTWWNKAMDAAGLARRKPYTTRHTFAIWSLVIGVHPERVMALMGHGSREMVYRVYGRYRAGVEEDAAGIRAYFGEDFR